MKPLFFRSPYGVAKLFAYWSVINFREAYDMFACNGILFNHESPRRGETFVTRKITRSVAKISLGQLQHVELGNIDSQRLANPIFFNFSLNILCLMVLF